MQISNSTLLVISSLIITSCATTPSGQTFDSPVGVWNEKYKTMSGKTRSSETTIVDNTSGTYILLSSGMQGRLVFTSTAEPLVWKGYWVLESGSNPCSTEKDGSVYWGEQVMNFNETFNQFTGTWDNCGEGSKYSIKGVR